MKRKDRACVVSGLLGCARESVCLGNFELSRARDMSRRNYTDRLEIDLKTQLCDFTERDRIRPGVRARNVTGIIRH